MRSDVATTFWDDFLISVTTASRVDLARLFAALGFKEGAEIGVWRGDYSTQLCEAIPGLHLRCIDPWQQYKAYKEKKNNQARLDDAYRATCETLKDYDCTIIRMDSVLASVAVPNASLDFVYIDANHEYEHVTRDLNAWVPKVRTGGIVSGHDYVNGKSSEKPKPWIQVKDAVDKYTAEHGIGPVYVLTGDKSPSWFWVQP